jgi:hypothetical protein
MPKMARNGGDVTRMGPVEDRRMDFESGYTAQITSFGADIDATPLMAGLPGNACQSPHWGYVLKGRQTYRFADHEETFEEGDAFYVGPGHVPIVAAGTVLVQFSPTPELQATAAVMTENGRKTMGG